MQASRPSSVDLPEPDGPAITVSWWRAISTSTRSTATTGPLALSKRRVTASAHATEGPECVAAPVGVGAPDDGGSGGGTHHLHRSGADHADDAHHGQQT